MNNANLKAIYKELVDAMAEAKAQKPGKKTNGEYPSINSVVNRIVMMIHMIKSIAPPTSHYF